MSALCQLQEFVLLAATSGYAACMESRCWLADNVHGDALFGAVKSWPRTYLAQPKRKKLQHCYCYQSYSLRVGHPQELRSKAMPGICLKAACGWKVIRKQLNVQ